MYLLGAQGLGKTMIKSLASLVNLREEIPINGPKPLPVQLFFGAVLYVPVVAIILPGLFVKLAPYTICPGQKSILRFTHKFLD